MTIRELINALEALSSLESADSLSVEVNGHPITGCVLSVHHGSFSVQLRAKTAHEINQKNHLHYAAARAR